jgi:hypothetical protein
LSTRPELTSIMIDPPIRSTHSHSATSMSHQDAGVAARLPAALRLDRSCTLHCRTFFAWYNDQDHHSGLGLHTAADVHHSRAGAVRAQRAIVLTAANAANPERFIRKPPVPPKLPAISWINKPDETEAAAQ